MNYDSKKATTPVKVYCRIKPHHTANGERCVNFLNSTQLELVPPCSKDVAYRDKPTVIATFTRVFPSSDDQRCVFDEVGEPLIRKLIKGTNGLLFAYGVTCSGKTHTLTGSVENPGIIPQSIALVYNTLSTYIIPKNTIYIDHECVVTPDNRRNPDLCYYENSFPIAADVVNEWLNKGEINKIELNDDNSRYAIFVSYIELYNGRIYDLLSCKSKTYDRSLLRVVRDYSLGRNVFTECEYQMNTKEEALSAYLHAQNFRKFEKTSLNKSSSRGHAIFTMRIVRIVDSILSLSESNTVVSQLSICDLAGSERARRTNNEHDRQREANNINVSLSNLQKCIMIIRDNQRIKKKIHAGSIKIVPYRDNQLTMLFKQYFEGSGKIRMLICISPRADEYDENIHVLRFSEMTKEVAPEPVSVTSRIRGKKHNTPLKTTTTAAKKRFRHFSDPLSLEVPPCPPFILEDYRNTELIPNYVQYIRQCMSLSGPIRKNLIETLKCLKDQLQNDYSRFKELEVGNLNDHAQIGILTANLNAVTKECDLYKRKVEECENDISFLQNELKKYKDNFTIVSHENKRLKEEVPRLEIEISKRYDNIYRERLSKYAMNISDNLKKINQIRDITSGGKHDSPHHNMR